MDGRTDGRMDGWTDGQTDGRTDKASYRVARPQLKKTKLNENKAGYTATSCGRVGRGGNARFPTFQLGRDRPTDQRTDGPTDGESLL